MICILRDWSNNTVFKQKISKHSLKPNGAVQVCLSNFTWTFTNYLEEDLIFNGSDIIKPEGWISL